MFGNILSKAFGSYNDRELRAMRPLVDAINKLEPEMQAMSDAELAAQTDKFRKQLAEGATLDDILVPAFATVREAGRRTLKMRHFDVQLMGGIALHQGKIAEMNTGEGKTLVAPLAAYLNALTGEGVHVVTVNDYLAKRDSEWMGKLYNALGLSVGVVVHGMDPQQRRAAYAADITYGTNNEFGFDYLRDNMQFTQYNRVQRGHNFAVVDEVDSVLIDEARTPLIISGPSSESGDLYYKFDRIVPFLKKGEILNEHDPDLKEVTGDFSLDEKSKRATLTEAGLTKVEQLLGISGSGDIDYMTISNHAELALRAHYLYEKDDDYVVENDEVVIVDKSLDRKTPGRRWSDGLHQAIEAKHGLVVKPETQTLATITYQNYFRMYKKLSGMTGTASTEAAEFQQIYNLGVVTIPTNKKLLRKEFNDVVYKTENAKYRNAAKEIKEMSETGRPVLVGTASIEKSERLSKILTEMGVPHQVLNAKHDAREASIVAQAGRRSAVTVATNMAGRGTDIVLGGNADFIAREQLQQQGKDPDKVSREEWEAVYRPIKEQTTREREEIVNLGGLHIVGTERHESRRVDNQLRGRAGRQGDPGSSRFYVSLEDPLVRVFGGDKIKAFMERLGMDEDEPIDSGMVSRRIANAQKGVENHNFSIRKELLEYDDVMNMQRKVVYTIRNTLLEGGEQSDNIRGMIDGMAEAIVEQNLQGSYSELWNWDGLEEDVRTIFGVTLQTDDLKDMKNKDIAPAIADRMMAFYEEKTEKIGYEHMRSIEQAIMLNVIDSQWKDHLFEMDSLKQGIGLRGYGQKEPLAEYKHEAFRMFKTFMRAIEQETLQYLFGLKFAPAPDIPVPEIDVSEEFSAVAAAAEADGEKPAAPVASKTIPPKPKHPGAGVAGPG